MSFAVRHCGSGIQVGLLVGETNCPTSSNCLFVMCALLEKFLHNCLELIDQVFGASWLAPSSSCMSAQLLLADCPCQVAPNKHCMSTYELSKCKVANRLCYRIQDSIEYCR